MSAAHTGTPQPPSRSSTDASAPATADPSSSSASKIFSPRSAAAMALSHFSRQSSQASSQKPAAVSTAPSTLTKSVTSSSQGISNPSTARSSPSDCSLLTLDSNQQQQQQPPASVPVPMSVPSAPRRESTVAVSTASKQPRPDRHRQSSPAALCFYPPHPHFGAHPLPVSSSSGPPPMSTWTPHRGHPSQRSRTEPMVAVMHPHPMAYFHGWEPPLAARVRV